MKVIYLNFERENPTIVTNNVEATVIDNAFKNVQEYNTYVMGLCAFGDMTKNVAVEYSAKVNLSDDVLACFSFILFLDNRFKIATVVEPELKLPVFNDSNDSASFRVNYIIRNPVNPVIDERYLDGMDTADRISLFMPTHGASWKHLTPGLHRIADLVCTLNPVNQTFGFKAGVFNNLHYQHNPCNPIGHQSQPFNAGFTKSFEGNFSNTLSHTLSQQLHSAIKTLYAERGTGLVLRRATNRILAGSITDRTGEWELSAELNLESAEGNLRIKFCHGSLAKEDQTWITFRFRVSPDMGNGYGVIGGVSVAAKSPNFDNYISSSNLEYELRILQEVHFVVDTSEPYKSDDSTDPTIAPYARMLDFIRECSNGGFIWELPLHGDDIYQDGFIDPEVESEWQIELQYNSSEGAATYNFKYGDLGCSFTVPAVKKAEGDVLVLNGGYGFIYPHETELFNAVRNLPFRLIKPEIADRPAGYFEFLPKIENAVMTALKQEKGIVFLKLDEPVNATREFMGEIKPGCNWSLHLRLETKNGIKLTATLTLPSEPGIGLSTVTMTFNDLPTFSIDKEVCDKAPVTAINLSVTDTAICCGSISHILKDRVIILSKR